MAKLGKAAYLTAIAALLATSARAGVKDTFIKSSEYRDGEEVVGKFLNDEDYGKMIEEVERNEVELDWAWAKTPDGKMKSEPKKLGFDVSTYKKVSLGDIKSFHKGMVPPGFTDKIVESLTQAFQALGLEVGAKGADLEFATALVDYKQDGTFVVFANIQPFVEIEGRLKDLKTGEVLFLVRSQAHGDSAEMGGFNFADSILRWLK